MSLCPSGSEFLPLPNNPQCTGFQFYLFLKIQKDLNRDYLMIGNIKLACSKLRENMPFFEHKHAKFTISSK
jgi:hypothetical protein